MTETDVYGHIVRHWRRRGGWTQKVLGEVVGVSQARISRIEGGVTEIPISLHFKLRNLAMAPEHAEVLAYHSELQQFENWRKALDLMLEIERKEYQLEGLRKEDRPVEAGKGTP